MDGGDSVVDCVICCQESSDIHTFESCCGQSICKACEVKIVNSNARCPFCNHQYAEPPERRHPRRRHHWVMDALIVHLLEEGDWQGAFVDFLENDSQSESESAYESDASSSDLESPRSFSVGMLPFEIPYRSPDPSPDPSPQPSVPPPHPSPVQASSAQASSAQASIRRSNSLGFLR
jgi:hypothetical protein